MPAPRRGPPTTPARIARLHSEAGPPADDVWLLHVLVDRARHSGLSGLEALGLFESWQSLSGYESEGCRLFLTAGVALTRDLLPPLWRLLSNDYAASLLALGTCMCAIDISHAIYPW